MKYRYYLLGVQHHRNDNKFIKNCDVHIEDMSVKVKVSFVTDKEPIKRNIDKIIQVFEDTCNNEKLSTYYTDVELIKVERIRENKKETDLTR